jgi:RimJ/RimL family protein N-acetyltransferase
LKFFCPILSYHCPKPVFNLQTAVFVLKMEPKVFIETPRLVLREWIESDEMPYMALNADKEVMEFFPSIKSAVETLEQIERLKRHMDEYGYGFFAVERKDNKELIGFTGLSHPGFQAEFTPCVEVGWRLSKENWGQGFATEAAKACLHFGFVKLGLDTIYAFTSIHNIRSENVMRKIGMIKECYFDHPLIDDGSFLKKHVLYKVDKG